MVTHRLFYFITGIVFLPLAIIAVVTMSLMGLLNAILYGFTDPVLNHLRKCCNNKVHVENSVESYLYSSNKILTDEYSN